MNAGPRTAFLRSARPALLFVVYLLICVAPLALSFTELMPSRGFVVNLSVAMGFVALSVLGMQFVLGGRSSRLIAPFSINAVLRYHRQITLLAVATAFGHPLILFLADQRYRALLDIINAPLRAQLAWMSVAALTALIVTSIWRKALRLSYPVWHAVHSALSLIVVFAALGHALLVNYYTSEPWVRLAWMCYGAAFLSLAAWGRLIRPVQVGLRPWRVAELWPEPGGALTVGLEPTSREQALRFHAGQFAWIKPCRNPFSFAYRPFTISSAAGQARIEFTIKPVGSWLAVMRYIRVGDRMYVDGPHGSLTLERSPGDGYVFLACGVGVTPFLSMLSTLAQANDTPDCWLFLGNRHEAKITGIRQIVKLVSRMSNLTFVNVVSDPSDDWIGECGHIDTDIVLDYLPDDYWTLQFFVCARSEITRSLVDMLRYELDVPADHIHCEDFALA